MSRNYVPVYIDIEKFSRDANSYYERAKNGEKIIVTINGEPKYKVYADLEATSSVLNEMPRPHLTTEDYGKLIDLLDPLDLMEEENR